MHDPNSVPAPAGNASSESPEVEVVIEVPRGSFLKRCSTGRIAFVSPLPCPFNYGAVPTHLGLEGDLLDALVLGPRLRIGTRMRVKAWGAVTLTERAMSDDKLICIDHPLSRAECRNVLRFEPPRCRKIPGPGIRRHGDLGHRIDRPVVSPPAAD